MRISDHEAEPSIVNIYCPVEVIPDNDKHDRCYCLVLNQKVRGNYANNMVLRFKSMMNVFLKPHPQVSRPFYFW